jgi:hypothetical protein
MTSYVSRPKTFGVPHKIPQVRHQGRPLQHPTDTKTPSEQAQHRYRRLPAEQADVSGRADRNSCTPSSPPMGSSAAATCMSAWVSTPPVTARASTMVNAIPFLWLKEVARTRWPPDL